MIVENIVLSPGFLAGFMIGFSFSLVAVLVFRSHVKKITIEYNKSIKKYQTRINELNEKNKKNNRDHNLCKTAQKISKRSEKDPNWKIDIPSCIMN